jgi:hypothetical protein
MTPSQEPCTQTAKNKNFPHTLSQHPKKHTHNINFKNYKQKLPTIYFFFCIYLIIKKPLGITFKKKKRENTQNNTQKNTPYCTSSSPSLKQTEDGKSVFNYKLVSIPPKKNTKTKNGT